MTAERLWATFVDDGRGHAQRLRDGLAGQIGPDELDALSAEDRAGITLTESMAMLPASSVSGWYFWNPQSRYFGLGRIGRDQLEDYARRKGWSIDEAARWLAPNLGEE